MARVDPQTLSQYNHPPDDYRPLVLWLPPKMRQEIKRRAVRRELLDREIVEEILRIVLDLKTNA